MFTVSQIPYGAMPVANAVDVIAVFDTEGNIRPIYFKAQGDSVKVEKVLSRKQTKFAGIDTIEYTVLYISDDYKRQVKLHYYIDAHTWSMPGLQKLS